jgi:hypothetical protein
VVEAVFKSLQAKQAREAAEVRELSAAAVSGDVEAARRVLDAKVCRPRSAPSHPRVFDNETSFSPKNRIHTARALTEGRITQFRRAGYERMQFVC